MRPVYRRRRGLAISPDRILFVFVVVKWFSGRCSLMLARRHGRRERCQLVGWLQVWEWLARRVGVRGVSRPPWRQRGSPVALPGPAGGWLLRPGGRRPSAGRSPG